MKYWIGLLGVLMALIARAETDLSYGGGERQKLDLYRTASPNAPLVIYVHGGAWITGGKESYAGLGRSLAQAGVAVAIPNYRLSGGDSAIRHPEHARDIASAVEYAIEHTAQWGTDPTRVFLVGHSAGAHIAATIATDPRFAAVAAKLAGFVGIEGIYDIPALVQRWPTYRDWFVTLAFGERAEWRKASPQFAKPRSSRPWLLVHSSKDELVDVSQTRAFAEHLKQSRVPVRLDLSSRESHFGVVQNLESTSDPIRRRLVDFLKSPPLR